MPGDPRHLAWPTGARRRAPTPEKPYEHTHDRRKRPKLHQKKTLPTAPLFLNLGVFVGRTACRARAGGAAPALAHYPLNKDSVTPSVLIGEMQFLGTQRLAQQHPKRRGETSRRGPRCVARNPGQEPAHQVRRPYFRPRQFHPPLGRQNPPSRPVC